MTREELLEKVKEAVIRASDQLDNINKGLFLMERREKVPKNYRFSFEAFREQLKWETYDFEGLRLRLELYRAFKRYEKKNHEEAWKLSFGEDFKEDYFWQYLGLGFGYLLNCIASERRDMPVLASRFFPFCTTYNCEFKRGGCLFSISEDIFAIIEVLRIDEELKRDFNKKILDVHQKELEGKIYNRLLNLIKSKNLLPLSLGINTPNKGDPYITTRVLFHFSNVNDKFKIKSYIGTLSKCISNPKSLLYVPGPDGGKMIVDDSPILKIKIAHLLLNSTSLKNCTNCNLFITQQVTLSTQLLTSEDPHMLMGPAWGRDRYSSIGWCSHSDVFAVIIAMDFLLDAFDSEFAYDNMSIPLERGIEYLLNVKNTNNTWPVVDLQKFKQWEPPKSGDSWDSKEAKHSDWILFDYPELFNVSFSNTVGAVVVLLKALHIFRTMRKGDNR